MFDHCVFLDVIRVMELNHLLYCYEVLSYTTHSMAVLYIWDHEGLRFLTNNIDQNPASQYLHGGLAVLVKYNQAQKFLQYNSKCFQ